MGEFREIDNLLDFGDAGPLIKAVKSFDIQPEQRSLAKKADLGSLTSMKDVPETPVADEGLVYRDFLGGEHDTKEAAQSAAGKQYVGMSAVSTGLKTIGSVMSTQKQEAAALDQLRKQFDFQAHELEANTRIRGMARTRAQTQNLLQVMNQIDQQRVGGGRQVQQFFRNPMTGARV